MFGNVVFSSLSSSLLTDSLNPPISSGPKTKKIKDKEGATFQDGKIHITASSSDLCKVNVTRFSREDFGVWNFSAEVAEKGEVMSSEHTLDKIGVPCELIKPEDPHEVSLPGGQRDIKKIKMKVKWALEKSSKMCNITPATWDTLGANADKIMIEVSFITNQIVSVCEFR